MDYLDDWNTDEKDYNLFSLDLPILPQTPNYPEHELTFTFPPHNHSELNGEIFASDFRLPDASPIPESRGADDDEDWEEEEEDEEIDWDKLFESIPFEEDIFELFDSAGVNVEFCYSCIMNINVSTDWQLDIKAISDDVFFDSDDAKKVSIMLIKDIQKRHDKIGYKSQTTIWSFFFQKLVSTNSVYERPYHGRNWEKRYKSLTELGQKITTEWVRLKIFSGCFCNPPMYQYVELIKYIANNERILFKKKRIETEKAIKQVHFKKIFGELKNSFPVGGDYLTHANGTVADLRKNLVQYLEMNLREIISAPKFNDRSLKILIIILKELKDPHDRGPKRQRTNQ